MAKKEWRPFRYFNVEIVRIIDGDTIEANIDVGFHFIFNTRFRLLGVDTPERGQDGYQEAAEFVQEWCNQNKGMIEVETLKKDGFGRWLAMFRSQKDGHYLNKRLIEEGYSSEYRGGPEPYILSEEKS